MMILKTILFIILIILLIVILILFLLLIIPFKYRLELIDKNDKCYTIDFRYLIIKLKAELNFEPKFRLLVTLFNKKLVDSSEKKEKKKKESISDTGFIKNKDIEKEVASGKKEVKKLFSSAKNYEKKYISVKDEKLSDDEKKNKIDSFDKAIDKFKNLIPTDFIYVIKRFVAEGISVLEKIKPTKCKIDISYDGSDAYRKGMIMAFAAPLYSFLGDDIKLRFDNQDDNIYKVIFTGRPILITLLAPIFRLLLDKKVRNFIFKKK